MTNEEFDVLDELYFVKSFDDLVLSLQWEKELVLSQLWNLIQKDWVKCFVELSENEKPTHEDFLKEYMKMQFVATKSGLLAHNRN